MWPFRVRNPQQTASEPPQNAPELPQLTVAGVETALREMEAEIAALQLQWSEILDKIGKWAGRTAARERRRTERELAELNGDGPETAEDAPGATIPQGLGNGSLPDRSSAKAALRASIHRR